MDTREHALKTAFKKVLHKAAKSTDELTENKSQKLVERLQNCKTKTCNWQKS